MELQSGTHRQRVGRILCHLAPVHDRLTLLEGWVRIEAAYERQVIALHDNPKGDSHGPRHSLFVPFKRLHHAELVLTVGGLLRILIESSPPADLL